MEKQNNEFLGLLCSLYLVALLLALPLYTGQGYWQLGNTKYILFRNITVLSLGCWLVIGMPERLQAAAGTLRGWKRAEKKRFRKRKAAEENAGAYGNGLGISGMDLAVLMYGICALVSAVCSSYGELAWVGYDGWFMGAVSQLLFAGIYFFVSRQYDGGWWPLYLGEIALGLVTGLGLLHRLGIDPLGLLQGWNSGDWEYSHMLSTLGNINWLCGYYSVAIAYVTAHYLLEKRSWVLRILYVTEVSVFVLLGIQGSQSGILILMVCVVTCLWLGRHETVILKRVFLALGGFFCGMPLMWELMKMRGKKAAIVADGNVFEHVEWYMWVIGAAVCFGCFFITRKWEYSRINRKNRDNREIRGNRSNREIRDNRENKSNREIRYNRNNGARCHTVQRRARTAAVILGCIAAVIMLAGYLYRHPIDDSFGSGRGFLWRISLESFSQADLKDKLLGAGPDCYGEAVFGRLGTGTEVWKDEHWDGAVFTNAHNEILSQLCNMGILGTVSYLAVFAAGLYYAFGLKRDRTQGSFEKGAVGNKNATGLERSTAGSEMNVAGLEKYTAGGGKNIACSESSNMYFRWLGALTLIMYGMHALVSFQQVLNTPLLFLTLGICEAERRRSLPLKHDADM